MKIIQILLSVVVIFASSCRNNSRIVTLRVSDAFVGPVVFKQSKDGLQTDTNRIDLAIPADGIVRLQSIQFFHEWSSLQVIRINGDIIPFFNDEPYNAQKVGLRIVHQDDGMLVYTVGTQAESDALRHRPWK